MRTKKFWNVIADFSGFTAVALEAFDTHVLKNPLSTEMLEIYQKVVFII